jgi:hypothetical protein
LNPESEGWNEVLAAIQLALRFKHPRRDKRLKPEARKPGAENPANSLAQIVPNR